MVDASVDTINWGSLDVADELKGRLRWNAGSSAVPWLFSSSGPWGSVSGNVMSQSDGKLKRK